MPVLGNRSPVRATNAAPDHETVLRQFWIGGTIGGTILDWWPMSAWNLDAIIGSTLRRRAWRAPPPGVGELLRRIVQNPHCHRPTRLRLAPHLAYVERLFPAGHVSPPATSLSDLRSAVRRPALNEPACVACPLRLEMVLQITPTHRFSAFRCSQGADISCHADNKATFTQQRASAPSGDHFRL